jgi:hypothetical protein
MTGGDRGGSWGRLQPTRGEQDDIEAALDRVEPVARDQGVLLYDNSDTGEPVIREVPEEIGRQMIAADGGDSDDSRHSTRLRRGLGAVLGLAMFGYAALILQQVVAGAIFGVVIYAVVGGLGRGRY